MAHPGVFLSLPFYFGAGFAVASIARGVHRALLPADSAASAPAQRRVAAVVTFLVSVALVGVVFGLSDSLPDWLPLRPYWTGLKTPGLTPLDQFGLPDAAFAVGGISGWWFWTAQESRDRAIFAAGAAGFLIAVALQYDVDILDHITKFGAGSVSVELSDTQKNNDPLSSQQSSTPETQSGSGSPNTDRTDLALQTIFKLPSFAIRDEQFAKALTAPPVAATPGAAAPPGVAVDAQLAGEAPSDARAFIDYGCHRIEGLGAELALLQAVHRSEASALSVNPKIVAWIRRAYYLTTIRRTDETLCTSPPAPPDAASLGSPPRFVAPGHGVAGEPGDDSIKSIGDAFRQTWKWTDSELNSVTVEALNAIKRDDVLGIAISAEVKDKIASQSAAGSRLSAILDQIVPLTPACKAWFGAMKAPAPPHLPDPLPPRNSAFGAYFAIVIAEAEASIANVESAVQLLDRQIAAQAKLIQSLQTECGGKSGVAALNLMRARLTLVRLENAQIDIAHLHYLTLGRDADITSGWSLLSRMMQTAEDVEDILTTLRRDDNSQPPTALFAHLDANGALHPASEAACLLPATAPTEGRENARSAAASLAYLAMKMRNNAIDLVAQHPFLARAFPDKLKWLEDSADMLESFDFKCLKDIGYPLDPWVPAYAQHSVGLFREVEASDFGATRTDAELPGEDRETPRATLLCKAYVAYSKSQDNVKIAASHDAENPKPESFAERLVLSDPPPYVATAVFKQSINELRQRSRRELFSLSSRAVEKAQAAVKDCDRDPATVQ